MSRRMTLTTTHQSGTAVRWTYRWATVAAASSFVLALILGLLLVWDRGLYMDDYFFKRHNENLQTGDWQPLLNPMFVGARLLGQLLQQNIGHLIPAYELPARLAWALLHLACVLLLALIAYRLTGFPLAGVVTGWMFLMPVAANEMLLWFSMPSQHGIAALLFLVALYLMLRVLQGTSRPWGLAALAALCLALGLQFSEITVALAGYAPLLALGVLVAPATRARWRRTLPVAIGLFALGSAVVLAHYIFFIRPYLQTFAGRGQITLQPSFILERYNTYLKGLYDAHLSPYWGRPILMEAFDLGHSVIFSRPVGIALLLLLVATLVIYVATTPLPEGKRSSALATGLALFVAGTIWILAALLPTAFLTGQKLESRMLYAPLMGFALAGGGLVWGLLVLLQDWPALIRRLLLAVPAAGLVLSTIAMVGLCQVYKLRYQADQQQIAAVQQLIRPDLLPLNTTFVIPVPTDFHVVNGSSSQLVMLDKTLLGVFDVSWACDAALEMAFQRADTTCAPTNHWLWVLRIGLKPAAEGKPPMLVTRTSHGTEGHEIPFDTALAFTYRDGRATLLSPLVVTSEDGKELQRIDLPLAEKLRAQGMPVEPGYVAPLAQ